MDMVHTGFEVQAEQHAKAALILRQRRLAESPEYEGPGGSSAVYDQNPPARNFARINQAKNAEFVDTLKQSIGAEVTPSKERRPPHVIFEEASDDNTTHQSDEEAKSVLPKPIDRTIYSSPLQRHNIELSPGVAVRGHSAHANIHRICITGGACAGRTTAIARLRTDLAALGIKVLVVLSTATCVMNGTGANEVQLTRMTNDLGYLKALVRLQASLEDSLY